MQKCVRLTVDTLGEDDRLTFRGDGHETVLGMETLEHPTHPDQRLREFTRVQPPVEWSSLA